MWTHVETVECPKNVFLPLVRFFLFFHYHWVYVQSFPSQAHFTHYESCFGICRKINDLYLFASIWTVLFSLCYTFSQLWKWNTKKKECWGFNTWSKNTTYTLLLNTVINPWTVATAQLRKPILPVTLLTLKRKMDCFCNSCET